MKIAARRKSQSAMEYLVSYSWALIILVVALGTLFYLGLFNSTNLAPRVAPGSCQVFRVDGPGSTLDISTGGTCNNNFPEYVAQFGGGSNGIITVPDNSGLQLTSAGTISAWINVAQLSHGVYPAIINKGDYYTSFDDYSLPLGQSNYLYGYVGGPNAYSHVQIVALGSLLNNWQMVTLTWNGANLYLYQDGELIGTTTMSQNPDTAGFPLQIGNADNTATAGILNSQFVGSIANVQIYNATLDAKSVFHLYHEGIGGEPVLLQNLVGWWPLNGNANDYSGNGNEGLATGVIYTASWTAGYTTT
jgi:hypothetical protein